MTTITIQILETNGHAAPGKLADAEIHFTGGELDGLKLVGFAVWQGRDGHGQNVSFPSRQFTVHGERRSFSLLRWIAKRNAQDRLAECVLEAYRNQQSGGVDANEAGMTAGRQHDRAPGASSSRSIMEANERREPFEERHFTVPELASKWRLSREFVRQVVKHEAGVTEWVRQQPGRRRYRVLRVFLNPLSSVCISELSVAQKRRRLKMPLIRGPWLKVTARGDEHVNTSLEIVEWPRVA